MKEITHKQAQSYLRLDLDGLLSDAQRLDLQTHLAGCEACRAESESLSTLTSRLQSEFHERWDAQDGPSQNVMTNVRSQTRRIAMSNKAKFGSRALGGVALLVVLGFTVNFVISQLRNQSVAANGTASPDENMPITSEKIDDRLLAFTMEKDGNLDIYTMHADGSGLTNLTKNPAHDVNPFWSPDGKRIAYLSDRAGYMQVFTMNADGSDVFQVTYSEADHDFGGPNPWSPDGNTLVFLEKTPDDKQILYTIQTDGRNSLPLVNEPDIYQAVSWSPDGSHVAFIVLEPVGNRDMARIYVVDSNGNNNTNITSILPEDEDLYSWNYTWTREGNIRFVTERVYAENGSTKFAVYEATLDGSTLVEITKTSTPLEDWWNGTTFVRGVTGETLTWLRSDGTFSEFKPYENCQMDSEPQYFGFSRRSSTGYLIYAAGCPNGDLWLYWANPDGTDVRPLLASSIKITDGGLNDINWSPDGGYVTLTVNSPGITYLYILNVREALKNPLTPPEPIAIGGGDIYYHVSWQPTP